MFGLNFGDILGKKINQPPIERPISGDGIKPEENPLMDPEAESELEAIRAKNKAEEKAVESERLKALKEAQEDGRVVYKN